MIIIVYFDICIYYLLLQHGNINIPKLLFFNHQQMVLYLLVLLQNVYIVFFSLLLVYFLNHFAYLFI